MMRTRTIKRAAHTFLLISMCIIFSSCQDDTNDTAIDGTIEEAARRNIYLIDYFDRSGTSGDQKLVDVMSFSINGDSRRSLFEHPRNPLIDTQNQEVIFKGFELPGEAGLEFGIGVREEAYTAVVEEKHLGGIVFKVYVDDGQGRDLVFEQTLRPFERPEDRGWHDFSVDLSGYAGKKIDIIFSTGYAKGDLVWGHAFWSDPFLSIVRTNRQGKKYAVGLDDVLGYSGGYRSLLDALDEKYLGDDSKSIAIKDETLLRDSRRSLFEHPTNRTLSEKDQEVVFADVTITDVTNLGLGTALEFGIGVAEEAYDAVVEGKHLGGIIFTIFVDDGGGKELVFERTLRPFEKVEDRGWHDFSLDLSRYLGKTIDITLTTRYAPGDLVWGHAYWSEPALVNYHIDGDYPNIILISVDTLRADHLGCYGYGRNTSPNIDKFSREGVLYKYSFAHSPNTLESHSSIMTSLYPNRHLALYSNRLYDRFITLAEILSQLGYYTVSYNGGVYLSSEFGLNQGFDEYYSYKNSCINSDIVWESTGAMKFLSDYTYDQKHMMKKENFFLFIHTYQVHANYKPPRRYASKFMSDRELCSKDIPAMVKRGDIDHYRKEYKKIQGDENFPKAEREYFVNLYDAGIRYTDSWLGELFDFLKDEGLYDNSLIIILSDHGEQFYEHEGWAHSTVYGTESYVPLIIKYPHSAGEGVEKERIARSVDVVPTILYDFLNIDITDSHFDGIPLSRPLNDSVTLGFQPTWGSNQELGKISAIKGKYKFIYSFADEEAEVHEFRRDLLDMKKVAVDGPTQDEFYTIVSDEYRMFMDNREKRESGSEAVRELDEATKKQLKDLGYLQ